MSRAGWLVPAAIALAASGLHAQVFLSFNPGCSPDGAWLDGPDAAPVTSGPEDDTAAARSPDGRRLAFVRRTDGRADVWVVDSADGEARRLTEGMDASRGVPFWSDGS